MRRLIKGEIVALCLLVPLAIELLPATRVFAAVARTPRRRRPGAPPERLAAAVDRVLYKLPWIWRHTCLRRATVLAILLRREGRDAEVVIGVRRSPAGALEAHAWLRSGGEEPYLERSPQDGFTILLPPRPSARPAP